MSQMERPVATKTNTKTAATPAWSDESPITSAEQLAGIIANAQNAVLESQAQQNLDLLHVLLENFPGGVCLYDSELQLVLHNRQLRRLLDYPEELFAKPDLTMADLFRFNAERGEYGDGDIEELVADRIARAKEGVEHVYERTRPNGTILEVRGRPLADGGFVTTYFDVSEQRQRLSQLEAIVQHFPGGLCVFDHNLEMAIHNAELRRLLDYPDSLFADGQPSMEQLFHFNAERGEYGDGDPEQLVQERMELAKLRLAHEYRRRRPNGTVLEVRGAPIGGSGFLTTYVDVTERERSQAIIAHMAHHDALTDLPNRLLLADRLETAVAQARRGYLSALHYMDLDKFKPVNDTHGHAVGDELLKAVADRLRALTRDTDTVARLGGDEFVILQTGIDDTGGARILAERLLERLSQPFEFGGLNVQIGTSIGIALIPQSGTNSDDLLRLADEALYVAKESGRQTYRFSPSE